MTEQQGDRIIELLEELVSKINDVEYNTSQLTNLTCDMYVLDDILKKIKDIENSMS